jgi:hypothetical protein
MFGFHCSNALFRVRSYVAHSMLRQYKVMTFPQPCAAFCNLADPSTRKVTHTSRHVKSRNTHLNGPFKFWIARSDLLNSITSRQITTLSLFHAAHHYSTHACFLSLLSSPLFFLVTTCNDGRSTSSGFPNRTNSPSRSQQHQQQTPSPPAGLFPNRLF